jgi:hypothetical protein
MLDIAIAELATTEQVVEPNFELGSLMSTKAAVAII